MPEPAQPTAPPRPADWWCPTCRSWTAADCGICPLCGYDPTVDLLTVDGCCPVCEARYPLQRSAGGGPIKVRHLGDDHHQWRPDADADR